VAGKPVEASIVGAWTLPKPNTVVAFAEGEKVFWDSVNSLCKKTAAGYFCIGAAIVAAAATDSTVAVRLDGQTLTAAGA
jgi:predicted RecA/RadA family phage recombinase